MLKVIKQLVTIEQVEVSLPAAYQDNVFKYIITDTEAFRFDEYGVTCMPRVEGRTWGYDNIAENAVRGIRIDYADAVRRLKTTIQALKMLVPQEAPATV